MSDPINTRRRRLLVTTVAGISLFELGLSASATAQSNDTKPASRPASFDTIRQVNAGTLNIGYAEAGPQNGPVVILLHGWPYDIYSFAEVTPLLVIEGLPGHRAVFAWLPFDAIPLRRYIGHNLPQEAPKAFADAVIDVARF